ncbi:hypothetical protein AM1_4336 [Acaryochloris marina MBIC11017]|uniref:Uncharacterized protein n=1 Tax=Acaryochloris marina (strain MBIC 11017) TaxID=329726 RepID=B0CDW3_ACAM1|nr:hypothetical protein AM1_4336 [Acaryochloris marina MBIC11017]
MIQLVEPNTASQSGQVLHSKSKPILKLKPGLGPLPQPLSQY